MRWRQRAARRAVGAQVVGLTAVLVLFGNHGRALSEGVPAHTAQGVRPSPGEPLPGAPPFVPGMPTPLTPSEMAPLPPAVPAPGAEAVDPPVPIVSLRVRAPARVEPGKDIEYHLTVENNSPAEAHHVKVRDRLPAGARRVKAEPSPEEDKNDLVWDLGTLAPYQRRVIVLVVKPSGTGDVENKAYVQFEHGQVVRTKMARPVLRVRATAPAVLLPNPSIIRLEVTNVGTTPARNVVLTDELPNRLVIGNSQPPSNPPLGRENSLSWKWETLAPHETRRVELQVIATESGAHTNRVEVTAEGGLREQATCPITFGEAKLSLLITGPQRRRFNRPATYRLTVSNPGTIPARQVELADEIPPGISFVSASDGGRQAGRFVRWSLGTLPPGAHRTVQVVVRVSELPLTPQPWVFGNEAQVRAEPGLSDRRRMETRFEVPTRPTVEIDKSDDPLEVGRKAKYTIRLLNPCGEGLINPILAITVPEQLKVTGMRGPTTGQQTGSVVRFDPLETLEPRAEKEYTVEVEAVKAGGGLLRVELTDGRHDPAPPYWEEKMTVLPPPRLAPQAAVPALQTNRTNKR